ncbi:hypothetical protein D3C72_2245300 [compost metagenome]
MSRTYTPVAERNHANPMVTISSGISTIGKNMAVQLMEPLSTSCAINRTHTLMAAWNSAAPIATQGKISSGKTTFFT